MFLHLRKKAPYPAKSRGQKESSSRLSSSLYLYVFSSLSNHPIYLRQLTRQLSPMLFPGGEGGLSVLEIGAVGIQRGLDPAPCEPQDFELTHYRNLTHFLRFYTS